MRHLLSEPVSGAKSHTRLYTPNTTRQLNAGSTLDSALCWWLCVHKVQADTDPMSVK